jgi:hypothetical protein
VRSLQLDSHALAISLNNPKIKIIIAKAEMPVVLFGAVQVKTLEESLSLLCRK